MSAISRREFIKLSTVAGGSLVIGFTLGRFTAQPSAPPQAATVVAGEPSATSAPLPPVSPTPSGPVLAPNAYLRIGRDGNVTIVVPFSEMGQGIETAFAMIVADELDCDWTKVRVEQAPADKQFGDQVTSESKSLTQSYTVLRQAGAVAREMLLTAAAQEWGVGKEACQAENGVVTHQPSGKKAPYGELVEAAARLTVPTQVAGKNPKDFKYIGTPVSRISSAAIVTGKTAYGLDVRVPGMAFAAVARPPMLGGKLASFDPDSVKGLPGVRAVVQIDSGVAVVADTTWHAVKARDALKVQWDAGPYATLSSDSIRTQLLQMLEQAKAEMPKPQAPPELVFEATYEVPYLAHITMEPMNATADVRADRCEVWAPTQDRQLAAQIVIKLTGLPAEAVQVHVPPIGGGFGRRLIVDYVSEAVQVSKAISAPVQTVWTRVDDVQHDYYRPVSYHYLRAEMKPDIIPIVWRHLIASQKTDSGDMTEGARDMPYSVAQLVVKPLAADLPVPVGSWRSGFHSHNAFVNETFMDQIAIATKQDTLSYRLRLLDEKSPLRPALDSVQKKARWGTPFIEPGRFRGMACHITRGQTAVAMVAEVSVSKEGVVRVPKVMCAVDCGLAVNPDAVRAQIEGGIVFGLTGVLKGQVTVKDGRVEQSGLSDFPIPTMLDAPEIDLTILPSDRAPSGIGEMAVPVIAPAIANGVFAATGKWIRRLPIRPEDCKS